MDESESTAHPALTYVKNARFATPSPTQPCLSETNIHTLAHRNIHDSNNHNCDTIVQNNQHIMILQRRSNTMRDRPSTLPQHMASNQRITVHSATDPQDHDHDNNNLNAHTRPDHLQNANDPHCEPEPDASHSHIHPTHASSPAQTPSSTAQCTPFAPTPPPPTAPTADTVSCTHQENSTISSVMSISTPSHSHQIHNYKKKQQRELRERQHNSRPTRESVLKRLSDALLRRSLTMIDLSQRGLQPSDARLVKLALLQNSSLSVLKLGYNNLCDEGVIKLASGISNHGALTSLDLGFNNVGNEGCAALASAILSTGWKRNGYTLCKTNGAKRVEKGRETFRLHTLYLAGNRITEEGAQSLARLFHEGSGLRRMHLTGNSVGPDGMRVLMEAVTENEILVARDEVVALSHPANSHVNNTVGVSMPNAREGTHLEECSGCNYTGVEELFLGGTGMGHIGCAAVARVLEESKCLRVLSLSNCELDDEDALVLASAITKNCKQLPLRRLQLSFNNLTAKGIEALMNAIWGLQSLEELLLDNNRMETRGAQVVSAVLGKLVTLTKLDVGFNCISGTGMMLIMQAIRENKNLLSLSVSGNAIDDRSAQTVSYALAHNKSLKSIFLDHCAISGEGKWEITKALVSNSNTSLESLTGFPVGAVAVSLGLPAGLKQWTNEQVLKFFLVMWEKRRQEQEEHSIDKELDPLNLLPNSKADRNMGPLDRGTVVAVAKRAFDSLRSGGDEVLSRRCDLQSSFLFESPLIEDAVIVEANGAYIPPTDQVESAPKHSRLDAEIARPKSLCPPIPGDIVRNSPSAVPALDPATKKKNIVNWLCKNIQHLNDLPHLPLNSSELWGLHQHFCQPTIQAICTQNGNDPNSESDSVMNSFTSSAPSGSLILSEPCVASPTPNPSTVPASEPAIHGNMSMLKRKVSYRFLGEATHSCGTTSGPQPKPLDQSVSKLIEDMNGQSMQPKTKRARRNRSRISIVPRIKKKLDSFMDKDHQKALGLMRQLYYVETSLLNGDIYPVEDLGTATHLIGSLASDAETILVDMM